MLQDYHLNRRVLHGALVRLERSAGKLARSVLRGLGGREPTWLPGARTEPKFRDRNTDANGDQPMSIEASAEVTRSADGTAIGFV